MIRPVQLSDAPQLAEMYNYYIRETTSTIELEEITIADFEARIKKITSKFPYIVWEEKGEILGYACANTFRERAGYRFTVETSVYLRKDQFGKQLGTALYTELMRLIKEQGFHRAIGGLTLPNPASERFHEKLGFKKVAHFDQVGRKFDQWYDVGFWLLDLDKH